MYASVTVLIIVGKEVALLGGAMIGLEVEHRIDCCECVCGRRQSLRELLNASAADREILPLT